MKSLKYTVIKKKEQYDEYCNILEELLIQDNEVLSEEIDLLTLLVEKWDSENNSFDDLNPIELLKALMEENNLKSKNLVEILGLTKGTVSKILNYHKGLSKNTIFKLSNYFKVSQNAFNQPYKLTNKVNHFYIPNEKIIETSTTNKEILKTFNQLHKRTNKTNRHLRITNEKVTEFVEQTKK